MLPSIDTTVIGQEAEFVALGWRFDAGNSLQCDTLDLVSEMLSNGTAGLIDLNLNQPLKVMGAGAFSDPMTDYSMLMLMGYPNEGQTLEEVRELLLGELAKLRAGDFDDDLLVSVVNNNKLNYLRALDSNGARTRQLVNAFINHVDWAQEVGKLDRMAGMTKQQIVDFANRHLLDNNFVCVYKNRRAHPAPVCGLQQGDDRRPDQQEAAAALQAQRSGRLVHLDL